ncbi:MAG: hypothetical protein A2758_00710 [Candidatus Zambryskibacteria bacterium RIFCSPHIGHO2_01_FULL_49_18]|uniref:HD domain-containing protein n=2 Tax=Candidatus Zambryskiibacteriota TaxID=1817925 RepID=A0A1G2T3M8_9BACT|nr:MAG: hypothetical protein A2758_00710 [Candidatus Zambryskibacteria bacterium RIFCSPHIGHO2_01_FULL_49_18]OHB05943.1 MAG: hypothetical protein A3A26_03295 [Candidatus Zambryskibacteria bacterium RIFCSPLOWO2_01_FULL_47_14]
MPGALQNFVNYKIPQEIKEVSEKLSKAGFENFLVGGCVRDLVLRKEPKDWDITTVATPEEIQKVFPDSFYENDFGTVGVKTEMGVIEVTPYRLESDYSDARHPDEVTWAKNIEEDLARRDFTMNAIALELNSPHPVSARHPSPGTRRGERDEVLIDPFGGQTDIGEKIIRTVGKPEERFGEDALRIFRALRLSAELGFAIEAETMSAMKMCASKLEKISKERIRDEFVKIIMSPEPGVALEIAARVGILKFISDEFEKGIGVEQNKAHAYTVWEHLVRSLNHAAAKNFPLHVRLAALFHDIAKPHTKDFKNGVATFYGHEVVGARITRKVLENLKFPKEIVEKVYKLVRWHMFFSDTEEITLSAVRRMVRNVTPELIWDLMNVRAADRIGTGRPKEKPYRLRKYQSMIEEVMRDPISVRQLMINGKDIMSLTETGPGPYVGLILEILLSEVLNDPKLNTKEYLEKRVKELFHLSKSELEKQGREAKKQNLGEEEKEIEKIRGEYGVK